MPYKKLIETAMPVAKINAEAEREKTARSGMPANVHIWWSRTPMAVARGILFASLIDDPAEHPELFPTKEEQDCERKRLLQIAEALVDIDNVDNKALYDKAKEEIRRSIAGQFPTVYDPFVGGGAIPVEAHRLGLSSESSDLNAVAAMIATLVSDVPVRFANIAAVHPREEMVLDINLPGAEGFAEDVRYYGEEIRRKAYEKIGNMYPMVTNPETGKELEVSAWIWARTVKCPNPTCGCNIPLSSSYDLAKKKGGEAWAEPMHENGKIRFRIHREAHNETKEKPKVAQRAVFQCPVCGEITTDAYVKECGVNHQIHSQLIAVVADDGKKRFYLEATSEQETAAQIKRPKDIPHGVLPTFPKRFTPPSFGLTDYADLFTNRQLVFITTMIQLAKEIQKDVETHAIQEGFADDGIGFSARGKGALAYAQAVRIALVMTISRLLDRCSNLCSWSTSSGGALRNVFSRAAMPMIWDFAESNPFANAGGSFSNALNRACDALDLLPTDAGSQTRVADAAIVGDIREALISTELPYYDRASYSELSDFFYVWQKHGLEDLYPDYFADELSLKKDEMVSFSHRYDGDKKKADSFYCEKIKETFKKMYASASDEFPSNVAFIYKGNDAGQEEGLSEWETFVTAICDAGFQVTASWPLGRKYEASHEVAEARGIPITVVIRKKDGEAAQITRRTFVASVKRELPIIIEETSRMVGIMDLRASVIGRGLNIYTRNKMVLDADGSEMRPHMASRIIEQEMDTLIDAYYRQSEARIE